MNQSLTVALDTITIFTNIEVSTIDKNYQLDNLSYHLICPKPILESYIQIFSNVFEQNGFENQCIYYIETDFDINFYFIPDDTAEKHYVLGPFLVENIKEKELKSIITKHFGKEEIRTNINYYRMLPVLSSIQRRRLESLLKEISLLNIKEISLKSEKPKEDAVFISALSNYRNGVAEAIEQRYKIENGVLDCIRFGTPELLDNLGAYRLHKTDMLNSSDRLRNIKNLSLSGNTLFRKAAEQGGVPPVYLDRTSREFSITIEQSTTVEALENLWYQMIFDYCKLVQNEKLSGYSAPIRTIINHILLHLEAQHSLDELAKLINRNPKYLSTTFKREVGVGLNEYINSARIQHSLTLLRNTDYSVSNIAMLVGFNDANYFTKVFTKEIGCTPSQYRKDFLNNHITGAL